jgi:hypothetical protein
MIIGRIRRTSTSSRIQDWSTQWGLYSLIQSTTWCTTTAEPKTSSILFSQNWKSKPRWVRWPTQSGNPTTNRNKLWLAHTSSSGRNQHFFGLPSHRVRIGEGHRHTAPSFRFCPWPQSEDKAANLKSSSKRKQCCSEHGPICHLFKLILVIHANTSNGTNHIV